MAKKELTSIERGAREILLKHLKGAGRLRQDEAAERLGTSRPHLAGILAGNRRPGKELIEKIFKLYGWPAIIQEESPEPFLSGGVQCMEPPVLKAAALTGTLPDLIAVASNDPYAAGGILPGDTVIIETGIGHLDFTNKVLCAILMVEGQVEFRYVWKIAKGFGLCVFSEKAPELQHIYLRSLRPSLLGRVRAFIRTIPNQPVAT